MAAPWSTKRGEGLADDLNILLGDVCVQWGFCNRLSAEELIANGDSVTSNAFAAAVLTAEGMNPEYEIKWVRRLRRLFADRYGNAVSPETYAPP
ncbi:MAG: hypothetical protein JWO81_1196 [Alphaproteobacteria bacterium]|nr:hypothetical protein [Alphaproteobacteria bacterium]